jgi:hypothetical protein
MVYDISHYLLKTGPINLGDLVTRVPELATRLATLKSDGEIEIDGDSNAVESLDLALKSAQEEIGQHPETALTFLQSSLNQIPGARQLRVRLSESAFRRAMKS